MVKSSDDDREKRLHAGRVVADALSTRVRQSSAEIAQLQTDLEARMHEAHALFNNFSDCIAEARQLLDGAERTLLRAQQLRQKACEVV